MSSTFWVSYGLLWCLVVAESLLIFALLRELGRIYLRQPQSIARDGIAVGSKLPPIPLASESDRSLLQAVRGLPTMLICVLPDCPFCMPVIETTQRLLRRSPEIRALVLVSGSSAEEYEKLESPDVIVASPDDVVRELQVRASPFVFVVDADGIVRSRGLANSRRDVRQLLEVAGFEVTTWKEVSPKPNATHVGVDVVNERR